MPNKLSHEAIVAQNAANREAAIALSQGHAQPPAGPPTPPVPPAPPATPAPEEVPPSHPAVDAASIIPVDHESAPAPPSDAPPVA